MSFRSKSATLTANTVATISPPYNGPYVKIFNTGTVVAWATVDGSTPTVAGDDTYPVLPGNFSAVVLRTSMPATWPGTAGAVTVKVISTGTPTIAVVSSDNADADETD